MKRIYLTASQHFSGEVAVTYDDAGELAVLDFSGAAGLQEKTKDWMMRNMPLAWHPGFLITVKEKGFVAVAEQAEVTFEMFWEAYDHKLNAKRTRTSWGNLSKADRAKAYAGIRPYFRYLAGTGFMSKKNPDTYLRNRSWEDFLSPAPAPKPRQVRTGETTLKTQLESYATGKQQTEGSHRSAGDQAGPSGK